ncbi:MAG TPA: tetratricopeptide repeat protein, partial [Candidatus Kapabacteria bacterium]|nr:tetratricopeptide repeat protein [Candidatus Kapabacteria bacterium]
MITFCRVMLIGREQALRTLDETFTQALSGKGRSVFISGEAGIGKTTLILEWQQTLPGGCVFIPTVCPALIAAAEKRKLAALHPWRKIISALRSSFRGIIDIEALITQYAPTWQRMVPLDTTEDVITLIPNAANQNQIFQQFTNLLGAITEHSPLVIFIDDIEWADDSSVELFLYIAERIENLSIMLICADGGDDTLSGWGNEAHRMIEVKRDLLGSQSAADISIKNWSTGDVRDALVALVPRYVSDLRTESWLAAISGGNPFYMMNYITTLREDGSIDERGRITGDLSAMHHPISVRMAAKQRIRRLSHNAQHILGYASMEGEQFNASRLVQLINDSHKHIIDGLTDAEQRGVIIHAGTQDGTFSFSHTLFRQELYEQLSEPEKEALHREYFTELTAKWEGATEPEQQSLIASSLLFHAEMCGEYIFGAIVAFTTAKTLWNIYAEKEALEAIDTLITYGDALKESEPEFFQNSFRKDILLPALILHARIDDTCARYDRAWEFYEQAEVLADEIGDVNGKIDALNGRGNVLMHRAEFRELLKHATANKKLAEDAGYNDGLASATNLLGIASSETGNQQKALECFRTVLAIGEKKNDPIWQMRALGHIGNVHQALGEFSAALQSFDTVLTLTEKHPAPVVRVSNLYRKATVYDLTNEHKKALDCFEASFDIASNIGDRLGQATALLGIGRTKQLFYQYKESLNALTECYNISREIGNRRLEQSVTTAIGQEFQFVGDFQEALAWHQKSYRIAVELELKADMAFAMANLGFAYKHMERYQNAGIYLEGAIKILKEILGTHPGFVIVLRETADMYGQLKEYDKGMLYIEEAKGIADKMGYKLELAEVYLAMSRIYRNVQALDKSKESLEKALA